MVGFTTRTVIGVAAMFAATLAPAAQAAVIVVPPGGGLQAAIAGARPGDVVRLQPGTHDGPVTLDIPLTLEGEAGAVVVGNGAGSVITVNAADAVVRGLEIRGSGGNLETLDAGVFLAASARGARVERNTLLGNLYGVQLHGAADAVVSGNRIVGITTGRINESGNGVSVWNAPGASVLDNDISYGRDGIFVNASSRNLFRGNRFTNLRFAVHYMYANDSEVSDNTSLGNAAGYAIMYSSRVRITGNLSDGDRDHGLLLNYANGSEIVGNTVRGKPQPLARWKTAGQRSEHGVPVASAEAAAAGGLRLGPEKCVFIYNANGNRFRDNWFEGCAIGVHFTAGSEGNSMSGNAFVGNRNQVKYVGTRYLDWSSGERGNYWSDNPAFDLNGDGIGDNPYRPNDLIDRVLWTAPQAKVLINSPAVQVIRWAQAQFPALLPGGVVDSHPLMAPPAMPRGQE
ncbi:nitrous oxide reductase family maturation protein NosD [Devosia sp.]|uniref:nitrous oxide reductase family maturation protein NosD n=1 Tax=Devosia sp. TaxID=1871048 RepID=UPI002F1DA62B